MSATWNQNKNGTFAINLGARLVDSDKDLQFGIDIIGPHTDSFEALGLAYDLTPTRRRNSA